MKAHIIADPDEDYPEELTVKESVADIEHIFQPGTIQYRPCDKMWYRYDFRFPRRSVPREFTPTSYDELPA